VGENGHIHCGNQKVTKRERKSYNLFALDLHLGLTFVEKSLLGVKVGGGKGIRLRGGKKVPKFVHPLMVCDQREKKKGRGKRETPCRDSWALQSQKLYSKGKKESNEMQGP